MHQVVRRAALRHAVQVVAVLLPAGLHLFGRLGAHLRAADQQAHVGAQADRVERRVVLDQRGDGDAVAARNGIEGFAGQDGVRVERLAQLAFGHALRGRLDERDLQPLVGAQPLGRRRVVLHDHALAHVVGPGERVERFAREHGVDVEFLAADDDHRLRLFDRRSGRRQCQCQCQCAREESFHGRRIRICSSRGSGVR